MATIDSNAIVLNSLKYGDTSLIVRLYVKECGLTSFMLRGVLKSTKGKIRKAYFQPLTQLRISFNLNQKKTLHSLREAQVVNSYTSIPFDVVKQSIVMFLSEMISNAIKEEESNSGLFSYLESAFIWLDTHDSISNFHLLFLLNLSKYLGFYPEIKGKEMMYFDLQDGEFCMRPQSNAFISGEKLASFKKLLGINFDAIETVSFSKRERQTILKILIDYYELHLDGFRKPKSLHVLETIFA